MNTNAKLSLVEVRDGRPRVRWESYFLLLAAVVVCSAVLNGLLLAAGVWSGVDTVIVGVFVGVVVFNIFVIRDFNKAAQTGATESPPGRSASADDPPSERNTAPEPPRAKRCPRCGAALEDDAPEGLCPRCLMALNLATETELPGAKAGPHGTRVLQTPPTVADIARHFPQLEVLECLGRGGMGVVYKARQPHLNRFVALKILAPEREHDRAFGERFTREAQTLAGLNHPSIVVVYDFGKVDGLFYLLMEYVDGVSLRQLLQSKRMPPEEALAIVPPICEALQYAHEQGVVHRDIKPENILIDKKGRVKIADFGIAKIVGSDQVGQSLTQDQVLGTPHYMAPEQIEHPQAVDHRADIYSLGVVFYEMLTGELPLGKFAPPSRLVHVDVRLDEVVLHALEKKPERRYQHASEVKTDVETIRSTAAPADEFEPPAPSAKAANETLDLERVKNARRLVRWPATGLMAIGLCFPTVAGCFLAFGHWPANWQDALGLCCVLVIDYVILLGSWQMRRLKSYRLAVLAAIVSLVIALPGLLLAAFPIWALMVLYRPDVRAAFNDVRRAGASAPAATPAHTNTASVTRSGVAWKRVIVAAAAALLVIAVALLAVYGPSQARQQPVSAGAVVRVQEKLRREIQQRLAEGGWKVESLNVSVSPDLKRAECRLENNLKKMAGENLFEYVSGTLNIRHRGGGLWEVEGQGQLWLVHFTLDASAEMAAVRDARPPLPATAASFGPVREVTLNDIDDLRGGEAVDLDSGRLLDLPKDTEKRPESEQFQWLKEHSADVFLDNVDGRWGLLTPTDNELKLAPLPSEKWEVATERDLSEALARESSGLEIKQHGSWTVYVLATNAQPPQMFAFRTASGASGLLQITRFGENPNCARLRSKLLRTPKDVQGRVQNGPDAATNLEPLPMKLSESEAGANEVHFSGLGPSLTKHTPPKCRDRFRDAAERRRSRCRVA